MGDLCQVTCTSLSLYVMADTRRMIIKVMLIFFGDASVAVAVAVEDPKFPNKSANIFGVGLEITG